MHRHLTYACCSAAYDVTVEDKTWSASHFSFTADQAAAFYER